VLSSDRWATHPKEARIQLLSGPTGGVLPFTNIKFMSSCTVSVQSRMEFESQKLSLPYSYKHDHLISNASIPWCDLHKSQGKKRFVQILFCGVATMVSVVVCSKPYMD
jgi:hypothetical protein